MIPFITQQVEDFVNVQQKDKKWAAKIVENYYFYWQSFPITQNKDVVTLRSYANGRQSVATIKKSLFKLIADDVFTNQQAIPGTNQKTLPRKTDLTGIEWSPVPVLPNILNAAKSNLIKQPLSPICTAIDPIAKNKKLDDAEALRYQQTVNDELDVIVKAAGIKMQEQSLVQHSDVMASLDSLDIDPMNDEELALYQGLFTKLKVESAMEVCLAYDVYKNKMEIIKQKILDDHYVLGISSYERYMNEITGLPDVRYYSPDSVYAPYSERPDFNDVPFIFIKCNVTLEEFIKQFGDEITDKSQLIEIFNEACQFWGWKSTWNDYNDKPYLRRRISIPMVKMFWKSWDGINIVDRYTSGGRTITDVKGAEYESDEAVQPRTVQGKWKQCTYQSYYAPCSKKVFGFKRLDATYNSFGDESMSMFPLAIYKSAEESPVERVRTLVDNFERAYFKSQHSLLKSKPAGYNINLKHLRNVVDSIAEDGVTWRWLIEMFYQEHVLLSDSGDYDDRETFNNPAITPIPGTNMNDVLTYFQIMATIKNEIREVMGINEARETGTQKADAGLGIQELALQASLNSTYYIDDAMKRTLEDGYRYASCLISYILKPENKGTKPYEAIVAFAGQIKAGILEALNEVPLHKFGIKIEDIPTEKERQLMDQILLSMFKQGQLDAADWFAIRRVTNYKDAEALAILRQKKKALQAQKAANQAIQADLAKTQAPLQTKEKIAGIAAQAGIAEASIAAKAITDKTQLQSQLELILHQLKATSTSSQIQQRHINTLVEKTHDSNLEVNNPQTQVATP